MITPQIGVNSLYFVVPQRDRVPQLAANSVLRPNRIIPGMEWRVMIIRQYILNDMRR